MSLSASLVSASVNFMLAVGETRCFELAKWQREGADAMSVATSGDHC